MVAILLLRLLFEVHIKFSRPLHAIYVNLKAAFDSLDRDALWKALPGIGTPQKIFDLLRELYTGTSSRVKNGGKLSSSFQTTTRIRQGCVLARTLFCPAID